MNELSRRQVIASMAKSCLGVGLFSLTGNYIHDLAHGIETTKKIAKARKVIYLNMAGAMSHIDTLDPKPDSGPEVQGPVEAVPTSADGIFISQNFQKIGQHLHNGAIIRSLTSNQGAHMQASYLMHTSYQKRGTITHPTFGSWAVKLTGTLNRSIPAHVKIGGGAGGNSGFLEAKYNAVPIGNPKAGLANSKMHEYLTESQFDSRILLSQKLNSDFVNKYNQKQVRAYGDLYKDAVKLMRSKDIEAFDIAAEPESMHELYGSSNFGQGCLLARRLAEHNVKYIEVTKGGWDTHDNNFERVEANCQDVDKAVSALLHDLEMRGMLSDTLVVLTSEFGRTPIINPRNGRDHWPKAFSALLVGGGIKGGTTYGQSDDRAMEVAENPIQPEDLNATIAHLMGLSLNDIHYSPSGRPFQVANKGEPVLDIISI